MPAEPHSDYLPEKQLQMMHFLREHYRKSGVMPRLRAITQHFGNTNKAVLDSVGALAKKKRLSWDGKSIQSIKLLPTKDVFISYSSKDKSLAKKIADAFTNVGYVVWMDEMDIRIGENIVHKVFQGIRECRFFVVLLSPNSISSHWVQEEVNAARLHEIEQGQTVVLPLVTEDGLDIPSPLKPKKYLKISEENLEEGMRKLLESVVLLSLHGTTGPSEVLSVLSRGVDREYVTAKTHMQKCEWPEDVAYKEWVIHPVPLGGKVIERSRIKWATDRHRVKLKRYGGFGFPHETDFHEIDQSIMNDGFYMSWSYGPNGMFTQKTGYEYWRMFESGVLVARESLIEDAMFPDKCVLSLEWLEMDIVRPMLFVRSLKEEIDADAFQITLKIHGIRDRKLTILSRSRSGFHWNYVAKDNDLEMTATINETVDLLQTALDMTLNAIELFNWKSPSVDVIRNDLTAMLAGNFPD